MTSHIKIDNAGEHLVMAELLGRGHHAAMADRANPAFDIITRFRRRYSAIRVKTSTSNGFQWSCKNDGSFFLDFYPEDRTDFHALVLLDDPNRPTTGTIYVIPTHEVLKALRCHRDAYLRTPKRDGGKRKDTGHWALHFNGDRSRPNYGFEKNGPNSRTPGNYWSNIQRIGQAHALHNFSAL